MQAVFSGSGVRVLYRPVGGSETIVVVWSAWRQRIPLWAHETSRVSGLFVIPDNDHWYQPLDADVLMQAISEILSRYQTRISIGSSMGGFAALAFADAIGADRVIAFCPQFSADPDVVPFEPRWLEDRNIIEQHHHRIRSVKAECHLVFDPEYDLDAKHIDRIVAQCPSAILWPLRFSAHPPTFAIADMGWMDWLFELILTGRVGHEMLSPLVAAYHERGVNTSITAVRNRLAYADGAKFQRLVNELDPNIIEGSQKAWNVAGWIMDRRQMAVTAAQRSEIEDLRKRVDDLQYALAQQRAVPLWKKAKRWVRKLKQTFPA